MGRIENSGIEVGSPYHPNVQPEQAANIQMGSPYPPNVQAEQAANIQMGSPYPPNVQPGQATYVGNAWSSGLYDCNLDPTNAVMTAIFPFVTFGQIAEVLDAQDPASDLNCASGSVIYLLLMLGVCTQCVIGSKYRKKLRDQFQLVEAPYEDALSHFLCPVCSLCQEFRELKHRGLDPALGWQGILAQQAMQQRNEQITKPPQYQTMSM